MGDSFDDMADLNPFVDPAVTAAARSIATQIPKLQMNDSEVTQAIYTVDKDTLTTTIGPTHSPGGINSDLEDFRRREEELRRKELELNRQEQELANLRGALPKPPNFPPLPQWFPLKPCFYINIEEEIPQQHIQLANYLYLKLILYAVVLLINILGVACTLNTGIDNAAVHFVLVIIFYPVAIFFSFLCCFRTAYIALKSYSSFYLTFALLAYLCETIMHFFQLVGFLSLSWAGFITGAHLISTNHTFGGVVCIFIGIMFTALFGFSLYLLRCIHLIYQISGANLVQARSEFTAGAWKTGNQVMMGVNSPSAPRPFP